MAKQQKPAYVRFWNELVETPQPTSNHYNTEPKTDFSAKTTGR